MAEALCRHMGTCGGCSLPGVPYGDQLVSKEHVLRSQLGWALRGSSTTDRGSASGPSTNERLFLPVYADAETPRHFRQKVAFAFAPGPRGRGLAMGHYAAGSQRLVAVTECPVHSARGNRIAFALRDHLARAGIAAASPRGGLLRHVLVRTTADDREAVVMLVVTRNDRSLRAPVRALLDSPERPDGFFINVHDGPGPFLVGPTTLRVDGRSHVRESVGGLSYLVSPHAFFQTNVRAAAALQAAVVDSVGPATHVLELYCGSGLFSLALAVRGTMVLAIEENRQAIRDAEANLRLNRLSPRVVRFVAKRVEDALDRAVEARWDAVILDPPRSGCPRRVLTAVFEAVAPPRVVYVSCNTDALASEWPAIAAAGYQVERLQAVDMFPHTMHIEVIVTFVRRGDRTRRVVQGSRV